MNISESNFLGLHIYNSLDMFCWVEDDLVWSCPSPMTLRRIIIIRHVSSRITLNKALTKLVYMGRLLQIICKKAKQLIKLKLFNTVLVFILSFSLCFFFIADLSTRLPSNSAPSGYATNFGHSLSGEGHRGVEGVIVVQTLKTFVTRLSTVLTDPTQSDNVVCACKSYHNFFLESSFQVECSYSLQ